MAAIVVTGILAAWAIPAYQNSVSNKQLSIVRNELITLLHTARSEAVLKRTNVTLCPRMPHSEKACSDDRRWTNGSLVFYDQDGDGLFDSNDKLLIATDPAYADTQLFFPEDKIIFNRNGFLATQSGAFAICDKRADEFARGVVLANTGNILLAQDSDRDDDFIPEDKNGKNLTCKM